MASSSSIPSVPGLKDSLAFSNSKYEIPVFSVLPPSAEERPDPRPSLA